MNHIYKMNTNNKLYHFLCIILPLLFLGCQKAADNNNEELDPLSLVLKAKQVFSENNSYMEFQEIREKLSDLAKDAQNLSPAVQQEICNQLESFSDEVLSNFQEFLIQAKLTCSSDLLTRIDHFQQSNQDLPDNQEETPIEQIKPAEVDQDLLDDQEDASIEQTKQVNENLPDDLSDLEGQEQIPMEQTQSTQGDCVDQNGHFQIQHFSIPSSSYIDGLNLPYGHLALTFDDGPRSNLTLRLLDILDTKSAKATFFMIGRNIERLSDIALNVADRGHSIGSHSYQHRQLNKMSTTDALESVLKGRDILSDVLLDHDSVKPFFRFPFGALNSNLKDAVLESGLSIFSWNIDTRDWATSNPSKLQQNTWQKIEQANYRGILLFHELEQTIIIMPWLLEKLANIGFCLVLFH